MENERCESQTPIQFRCKKIIPDEVKSNDSHPAAIQITEAGGKQGLGNSLATPTPEKPEFRSKAKELCPSRKGKQCSQILPSEVSFIQSAETYELDPAASTGSQKNVSGELPERYKLLAELFDRMESSIRLLGLCRRLPTFQNISTQVEILTKRKFLHSHLAQMKYAFPEVIQIEKILIHDKESCLMKPDMKITLLQDVIGCSLHPDESASMTLCNAFHARLLEFFNGHPEGTEVPEAMLPEPFNQRKNIVINALAEGTYRELYQPSSGDVESLPNASHFSLSFEKQFSQKLVPDIERTQILASSTSLVSTSVKDEAKEVSKSPYRKDSSCTSDDKSAGLACNPSCTVPEIPDSTPVKYSTNPDQLMAETPILQTPKRALPTPSEKLVAEDETLAIEPTSARSARRSLIYSPSKADERFSDLALCTSDKNKVGQYSCMQTTATKRIWGDGITGSSSNQLQVMFDIAADDHRMIPTGPGKQEKLSSLLSLFDTICLVSRSCSCSLITKQELVHKIISNNLEIEDTREVEQLLGKLEDLVPDWISRETGSEGDLYCIKQALDPTSIRGRLLEVV